MLSHCTKMVSASLTSKLYNASCLWAVIDNNVWFASYSDGLSKKGKMVFLKNQKLFFTVDNFSEIVIFRPNPNPTSILVGHYSWPKTHRRVHNYCASFLG